MTPLVALKLALAWLAIVLPAAACAWPFLRLPASLRIPVALSIGYALTCLAAPLALSVDMDAFFTGHLVVTCLVAVVAILIVRRRHRRVSPAPPSSSPRWVPVLLAGAFAIRLLPLLLSYPSLGGGDARFHLLLAELIRSSRALPSTWEPFAAIPIAYPLGSHAFTAVLATATRLPVHEAFNIQLPIAGALTAVVLAALAGGVFRHRDAGLLTGFAYAFLPFWGGLDYLRWGGLPNAAGMLSACLLLFLLLDPDSWTPRQFPRGLAALLLLFSAAALHHYSLLVTLLFLLAHAIVHTGRPRFLSLALALAAAIAIAAPVLLSPPDAAASNSVLRFREMPISPLRVLLSLNPALPILAAAALWLTRRRDWAAPELTVKAALLALLASFVFLEYGYRAASIVFTRGADCFTALTPSRMATDMAYPLCILLGRAALLPSWPALRGRLLLGFALIATLSATLMTAALVGTGRSPARDEAGRWLRDHTPTNAMLVGTFPFAEYLSWRETSLPPLPASEARDAPPVAAKRERSTPDAWRDWRRESGRSIYFLFPPDSTIPLGFDIHFTNDTVAIATLPGDR